MQPLTSGSTLLQETADNGNGLYYTARNASELRYSLEYALQDIIRRISAGSAVAVVSTERGHDDRLFRGKFMPADWDGYLECYGLPYEDGDAPLWEAGDLLAQLLDFTVQQGGQDEAAPASLPREVAHEPASTSLEPSVSSTSNVKPS